jgi:hypothetical protein
MMTPERPNLRLLLIPIGLLGAAALVGILFFAHLPLGQAFSRVGSALAIFLVPIWFFLDRRLWAWPGMRTILQCPPDLRGRWEGTIDRGDSRGKHSFVIEIQQRFTSVSICTYSTGGSSQSVVAEIVARDEHRQQHALIYTWIGSGGQLAVEQHQTGMFYGTTILDVVNDGQRRLTGHYFTARLPHQTRGVLDLVWKGRILYNTLEISKQVT